MPTFKPVVLKGKIHINKKGESNIKILIVHHKIPDYIKTDHYIDPNLMNDDGKIDKKHPNATRINLKLSEKLTEYQKKILEHDEVYIEGLNVKQIKALLLKDKIKKENETEDIDFFQYANKRIEELKNEGREGTANSYSDSVKRLKEYIKLDKLPFESIDKKLLESFILYKKREGKSLNSIAVYIRSIKALFYDAIEDLNKDGEEYIIKHNPFKKIKIETEQTKFRNIELEPLKKIRDIELTGIHEIVRDICMLIFYLIGVNVKDLFYCKGLDTEGRFKYKRSKGKKEYSIKIEPEAQEIINKYKGEKYLLKFADHCSEERKDETRKKHQRFLLQYKDHRTFNKTLNENLKEIASIINKKAKENKDKIKVPVDLSTYYFRYAWGNIADEHCGYSLEEISSAYGHVKDNVKMTTIYVREKLKRIDKINRTVLNALK